MLRRFDFLAFACMVGIVASPVFAFRGGPPAGFDGSTASGGNSCRACHGNAIGTGSVQILNLPSTYAANVVYNISVRVADPVKLGAGFQLSVEDALGNFRGTVIASDPTNTQLNFSDTHFINHTGTGVNNAVANWAANGQSATYNFQWQAPSFDAGVLRFWAAGNAINNNLSSSGDTIYLTSVDVDFGAPTGACCENDTGQCFENINETNCTMDPNNRYGGDGSTCATINPPCQPPPTGACCDDGTGVCSEAQTQAQCQGNGRRYGGNNSTCGTINPACVPPASGACCDDRGVCTENVLQTECENNGSRFGGDGSTCATMDPPCETPLSISLKPYVTGLISPVDMANPRDGSGRNFIVEQTGQIRVALADGTLLPTPYLDIASKLVAVNAFYDERGLLGLTFHPDYAVNGRFFVRYSAPRAGAPNEPCNDPNGFIVGCHEEILAEYHVLGDPATSNVADPNSEVILYRADKPQFNHNGGQVAFGPDGYLYFTLGDGGGANDGLADNPPSHGPIGNAQNRFAKLGKVHRIDVDSPPDPGLDYAIPPTNPFANGVDGLPEIYAYGLRNPYKFSFDDGPSGDGTFWLPDVGQDRFEEINIGQNGGNYGWPIREASHCFDPFNPTNPPASCPTTGDLGELLITPVMEYAHPAPCTTNAECAPLGLTCDLATGFCSNEGGISIIGGYVYRSVAVPRGLETGLAGKYVFGDFSNAFFSPGGRLYYMPTTGPDIYKRSQFYLAPDNAPLGKFLKGMAEDENGGLYVLVSTVLGPQGNGGSILRIAAPFPDTPTADPSGIDKTKFISFVVPPSLVEGSVETALRVNLVSLHHVNPPYTGVSTVPFTAFEGKNVWVGPPATYTESSNNLTPFKAAMTQCTPYYTDWSTVGLLHVTGSAIVSSSVYRVENVAAICQTPFWQNSPACLSGGGYVSNMLEIHTTRWADVETPYNPPSTTTQPDLGDVSSLVNKFKDAPGAAIKVRCIVEPNNIFGEVSTGHLSVGIGFTDIAGTVDGFKGQGYPAFMGRCAVHGPGGNAGACSSDTDCVGNGNSPPCNLYCP